MRARLMRPGTPATHLYNTEKVLRLRGGSTSSPQVEQYAFLHSC